MIRISHNAGGFGHPSKSSPAQDSALRRYAKISSRAHAPVMSKHAETGRDNLDIAIDVLVLRRGTVRFVTKTNN